MKKLKNRHIHQNLTINKTKSKTAFNTFKKQHHLIKIIFVVFLNS
ncbi:hypothetical protein CHAB381_0933 [Campylobacter hominis ATCC BAA-381]|uniref:Uncharacterized protein n=1 Tax=Campylobacter hominis (strain ATCC BAA-381 / DSM 21671 / CCUG 45161 / LMG 19568 / NCTC 13146 / CH001A) TaxID=360107 RepID=A7I1V3_CAMHC|nr:hypothetical protein CHAB381_0933 [Campylobacter hominis ATCC BAA-381]